MSDVSFHVSYLDDYQAVVFKTSCEKKFTIIRNEGYRNIQDLLETEIFELEVLVKLKESLSPEISLRNEGELSCQFNVPSCTFVCHTACTGKSKKMYW